jgi:hypothetical protein
MSIHEIDEDTMHTNLPIVDMRADFELVKNGEFATQQRKLIELDGWEALVLQGAAESVFGETRIENHRLEAADTTPQFQIGRIAVLAALAPLLPSHKKRSLEEWVS